MADTIVTLTYNLFALFGLLFFFYVVASVVYLVGLVVKNYFYK
jgi:hypothetical protein